ncbi:MAG: hypothetical protein DID91_2727704715 [Candidatus Nitrotoga sp. MKT]|nr:MAG: hypothetical protein DID91_2727704715 [Candidatus Nitrotoga sp. MKT]
MLVLPFVKDLDIQIWRPSYRRGGITNSMHSLVLEAVEPVLHRSVILGKFPARLIEQAMPTLLSFLKDIASVLAYAPPRRSYAAAPGRPLPEPESAR